MESIETKIINIFFDEYKNGLAFCHESIAFLLRAGFKKDEYNENYIKNTFDVKMVHKDGMEAEIHGYPLTLNNLRKYNADVSFIDEAGITVNIEGFVEHSNAVYYKLNSEGLVTKWTTN